MPPIALLKNPPPVKPGVEPLLRYLRRRRTSEPRARRALWWPDYVWHAERRGERAVERLLTIVQTCLLQEINALAYLTAAIAAHRRHQVVTSLLRRPQTP